ncbi:uncharacterized protein LOC111487337 isoform X2 [Cucurbita maxima]|uniref:Uncharacterized protein LOC111487337 isoform X2 n=2 Tax=Cucurbita maxima TaxID=3661 RepID=A0A6J1JQ89_CUCMA|nr:uncharacterized protein LOC111487337 isoform X2 [Cucurbita maxima]
MKLTSATVLIVIEFCWRLKINVLSLKVDRRSSKCWMKTSANFLNKRMEVSPGIFFLCCVVTLVLLFRPIRIRRRICWWSSHSLLSLQPTYSPLQLGFSYLLHLSTLVLERFAVFLRV